MVGTQSLDSLGFGEAPDGPPEDALATAHNDVLAAMALREPREQKQDELFRIGGFLIAASSALADAVVRTAFQVARWRLQAAGTQTPLGLQSADVFSWWLPHKMLPWRLLARECIMQGTAEVAFYQSVATLSPSTGPTVAALMAVLYVWPLQFRSLSVAVAPEAIDALGGIGAQFHHILSHRLLLLSALGVGMACHIFKSTCVYVGFSVLRKRKPGATALYLPSLAMPVLGELFTDVATYPLVTLLTRKCVASLDPSARISGGLFAGMWTLLPEYALRLGLLAGTVALLKVLDHEITSLPRRQSGSGTQ
eukprot:m.82516 g.82516  ORF g.82516 m.82516 type:complete len:309 (-) comp8264_c0_seq2:116-1042(-)